MISVLALAKKSQATIIYKKSRESGSANHVRQRKTWPSSLSNSQSQNPYVLKPHVNSRTLVEDHVNDCGMREIDHAVSRQEALPLPNNGCVVNDLCHTLERVHVIGLNVV